MSRIDFLTVATNFQFLFDFYWHSLLIRLKSNILQDVCVGGTEMFEKIASPV